MSETTWEVRLRWGRYTKVMLFDSRDAAIEYVRSIPYGKWDGVAINYRVEGIEA